PKPNSALAVFPASTASSNAADHVGRLHRALRARWRKSEANRGYISTITSAIRRSGKCCRADNAAFRIVAEFDFSNMSNNTGTLCCSLKSVSDEKAPEADRAVLIEV